MAAQQATLVAGGDVNWARELKRPDVYFARKDRPGKAEFPRVPLLNDSASLAYLARIGAPVDTTKGHPKIAIPFDMHFASVQEEQRYPLTRIAPLLRAADIAFVNLENPLSANARESGAFRARPELADALRWAGVDVVSIANNHALDAEGQGLMDTMENLWRAGVGFVGGGRDLDDARRPFIIERNQIRIGFLGYTQFVNGGSSAFAQPHRSGVAAMDPLVIREDIRRLRDQVDYVVVSLHWGAENEQSTASEQRDFAHAIIDEGADIILGHHPHVPRGVESYHGKVIVYSFGNLIFGHGHDYWMNNYMARFTLGENGIARVELLPVAGRGRNLSQPYPLEGAEAQKLLENIRVLSAELDTDLRIEGNIGVVELSDDTSVQDDSAVGSVVPASCAGAPLRACQSTAVPRPAASTEAANTAIFTAAKSLARGNASLAMKSDMVKPIPDRAPAPASCRHEYSWGLAAIPRRTASADAATIPSGFPTTSPTITASMSWPWPRTTLVLMTTPALASANSGSTT